MRKVEDTAPDDDDDPSPGADSSNMSMSDTLSVGSDGSQVRLGETIKLFKKPVVKQWFHKGLLWRASEHTEIMAIELFFDLLYGKNLDFLMKIILLTTE